MIASATRDPVMKKKHVRFARLEDDEDNDEQEEDTLFDKNATRRGPRSLLKAGKRSSEPGSDGVETIGGGDDLDPSGACSRWIVSLALCASFLGLGMCISVLGPTFEDLAINVNQNVSNISHIFVGRSLGYIGGSLVGGILFDHMNPHLLLGISMLITAAGMFAIPFCKQALLLTAMMSCIGASVGILDTGGNVQILNTWGPQAGPHMQALYFSYAAGAFVSPIIAKLIFGADDDLDRVTNASLASSAKTSLPVVHQHVPKAHPPSSTFRQFINSTLKSMWAYIVIGFFIMLVSVVFFALYARTAASQDKTRARSGKPPVSRHHNALIALLFVFFFFYVGAEVAFGSFIFLFGKDYAHMDEPQAAGLNSMYWGTLASGRGLAIFFAACMHPGTMIVLSLVGYTLSALLLTVFSRQLAALWVCTGTYGLAMATVFPSGISWVEQYTTVTGRSAAVFVVGAAMGQMVLPALLGFLLGRNPGDHPLLMEMTLAASVITCVLFPIMYKLATVSNRGRAAADDCAYHQALLDSEEEEEEEGEGRGEVGHWNEVDFEVIEMDDGSLVNSPYKALPSRPGAAAGSSADAPSVLSAARSAEPPGGGAFFSDSLSLLEESPRRLSLDREKRD